MSKIVTIELSDDLYSSLQTISRAWKNQELNNIITYMIKCFINEGKNRKSDPIFSPITEKGSGITDVSEEHDKYLYGI